MVGTEQGLDNEKTQVNPQRAPTKGILVDIVLNAAVPWMLYRLSKQYISPSELTALLIATTFPVAKNILGFTRRRQLDPVSVLVLLSIMTSIIALFLGGSPKLLLIRESLFTGVFGLVCLLSLIPYFSPRPIMFYFGRYFLAGDDIEKRALFDKSWQRPQARFTNRLITAVWGLVYAGEFSLKIIMIEILSTEAVLAISPFVTGFLTIATVVWTFSYVKRARGQTPLGST